MTRHGSAYRGFHGAGHATHSVQLQPAAQTCQTCCCPRGSREDVHGASGDCGAGASERMAGVRARLLADMTRRLVSFRTIGAWFTAACIAVASGLAKGLDMSPLLRAVELPGPSEIGCASTGDSSVKISSRPGALTSAAGLFGGGRSSAKKSSSAMLHSVANLRCREASLDGKRGGDVGIRFTNRRPDRLLISEAARGQLCSAVHLVSTQPCGRSYAMLRAAAAAPCSSAARHMRRRGDSVAR
jgi:hypothetical protein